MLYDDNYNSVLAENVFSTKFLRAGSARGCTNSMITWRKADSEMATVWWHQTNLESNNEYWKPTR